MMEQTFELDAMPEQKSGYDSYEHELISNYVRFGIKRVIEDYQHDKLDIIETSDDITHTLDCYLSGLYHFDSKVELGDNKNLKIEVRFTMPGDEEESFRVMKTTYENFNIQFKEMMCRVVKPEGTGII